MNTAEKLNEILLKKSKEDLIFKNGSNLFVFNAEIYKRPPST